jgi:geranylgeranyl pyrophosphate synthase
VIKNTAQDVDASYTGTADALRAVEQLMFDVVDCDVTLLRDASRHILEAGGKRLRPRLALLSYAAVGGTRIADVVPVAAAIELMHTASVVHDDINDHGVVRRGRPSVNAIWGRTFALLTGDYLFTKVYELMAPYQDYNIVLAEAAVALVEGETLQASAVKEGNFTREVYYEIIGRKTAALFRAACRLGGSLGGATLEQIDALAAFGYQIGLAFQIIDDVLDLTASTDAIGKSAGLDLAQGKGYAAAYANGQEPVAVAEASGHNSTDPMETIKRKLLKGDAIGEARMTARSLVDNAVAMLDVLPDGPNRDALAEVALSLVEREF